MNRKKETLLAAIVALACLLVLTVVYGSPFEPVVQPVVDIEKIWAIEDARVESDVPLVTELENHGAPLAYERNENTFYCTLGMGNEEAWPDIHLTAQNVREGVQLVFVDDYKYDWCADAIRDGYPYQVMAYTDEAFWYFDIVFTSLPIVVLEADETITAHKDVPVDVSVSWQGEELLDAFARAHRRGATSLNKTAKNGFKVEFTRGETGPRTQADVPFLGTTDATRKSGIRLTCSTGCCALTAAAWSGGARLKSGRSCAKRRSRRRIWTNSWRVTTRRSTAPARFTETRFAGKRATRCSIPMRFIRMRSRGLT